MAPGTRHPPRLLPIMHAIPPLFQVKHPLPTRGELRPPRCPPGLQVRLPIEQHLPAMPCMAQSGDVPIKVIKAAIQNRLVRLLPHKHAVYNMILVAREEVLKVSLLDILLWDEVAPLAVERPFPVRVVEEFVCQVFIVAGGRQPGEGHQVEMASCGLGFGGGGAAAEEGVLGLGCELAWAGCVRYQREDARDYGDGEGQAGEKGRVGTVGTAL